MMGSNSKTCDLLFASIYMLIVQLIYIMTSNANKYKDQKPGGLASANNRQQIKIRLNILLFIIYKEIKYV